MVRQDDSSPLFGLTQVRAERESSVVVQHDTQNRSARPQGRSAREPSRDLAEQTTHPDEIRDEGSAPTIFENRTPQSLRAENAARALRPLKKTRAVLSEEFDGACDRSGISNVVIAAALGVTEKSIRQYRGRDLLPGEVAKPIPIDMLVHLPDALFQEMYDVIRGLRVSVRVAAREEAARKAGGGSR